MPLDHHLLSFLIRWTHVASMAAVLGGAVLLTGLTWKPADGKHAEYGRTLLLVAETYEWLFWGAVGLLVMTGVGNLGAFGAALPDRQTGWGMKLTVKLLVVLVLILLSLVRTMVITRLGATGYVMPAASGTRTLRTMYGTTALVLIAILGLAVSLAHG